MIEFLCPNGHRIRCLAAQVGRAAKCPKCGVRFRVPDAAELDVPEMTDSDPNVSRPDFIDSGKMPKSPSSAGRTAAKEPEIEFLCPNGHRLHGPASLQGRPGECPDCGSRFRIPTYEDIPSEEPPEQEISLGRADGRDGSDIVPRPASGAGQPTVSSSPAIAADVATPALLARLWNLCPKGTVIEIRLRNGETIAPDRFLARASRENRQGMFTVVEADGSVSLVVVPWDAVDRVTLRGLKEVPAELADG